MKSGFILINKDKNISSQKIDSIIKKKFNANKVGHLGTLDPLAEGLLVVGINRGTRYFKYFENSDKVYILRIRLGVTSISLDYENELINITDTDLRGKEPYIDEILNNYNKEYNQYPPIYSAIKVDGIPLYKYAIKNMDVEIKSRNVKIYSLKRISNIEYKNNSSYFDIYMHVSKGFYVRSFCKEFGDILEIPSICDNIKRIGVNDFKIENSIALDNIENIDDRIIDPLIFLNFKEYYLSLDEYKDVTVGIPLKLDYFGEYIKLYFDKKFIAIYSYDNINKIYKMDLVNLE